MYLMRVSVCDSGLCCCVCVTFFECSLRGDTGGRGGGGCKIDQIVFWGENEIGADFDTLTSLVIIQ